jgi:uncharacterized protein YcaQ
MSLDLSLAEARQVALAAQGFGQEPVKPTLTQVRKVALRILAIQLDSINVLVRSHYLPVYSRLGPYPMAALDKLTYERRELFETWGHAACLMPVRLYPLQLYRTWPLREVDWVAWPRGTKRSTNALIAALYDEVAERGPLTAAELSTAGPRKGPWWNWDDGKIMLENLLDCGILAVAGRRGFTRLYDLAERVIPREVLDAPELEADEAQREQLVLSAAAVGVGTAKQVAAYLGLWARSHRTLTVAPNGRWRRPDWKRRIAELVEEGRLEQVAVEGWKEPGHVVPGTRVPSEVHARALLTPFDPFIRVSAESLCGFTNPLSQQLYVPAERRQYGYYVLPFLLGDTLVGRCDLKADRERGTLMVRSAYVEPGQNAKHVAAELAEELERMGIWLELDTLEVGDNGNLAKDLRRATP